MKHALLVAAGIVLLAALPASAANLCRTCFEFIVHNETKYDAEITTKRTSATTISYANAGQSSYVSLQMNESYALKAYFKKPGSLGYTIANVVGKVEATSYLTKGSRATLTQSGSEATHTLQFHWR